MQYFKAAMDAVGLVGGAVRPPRLELTGAERDDLAAALRALRERVAGMRAARYFAAVDSHTEGMPDARDHRRRRADPRRDDARARARTSSPRWTTSVCC